MEKDIRIMYAEFNAEANRHFFSIFNEFSNAANSIERDGYENLFQLTRAKYSTQLKHKLEKSADTMINKCELAETMGRLRINFTEAINYYLKEFTRKSVLL